MTEAIEQEPSARAKAWAKVPENLQALVNEVLDADAAWNTCERYEEKYKSAAFYDALAALGNAITAQRAAIVEECAKVAEGVAERNVKEGKVFTERVLTAQVIRDKIRDLAR